MAAGQIWASTEQLNYIMDLISEIPSLRVLNTQGTNLLTPREEQVVALVAEGLGNREIARELNLSEHTIKKYLYRIFEKLGISTAWNSSSTRSTTETPAKPNGSPAPPAFCPARDCGRPGKRKLVCPRNEKAVGVNWRVRRRRRRIENVPLRPV